jgi:hypothetical protein
VRGASQYSYATPIRGLLASFDDEPQVVQIRLADSWDSQQVIGIDINPTMQPEELPENVFLQVDDLNRRFTFPAHNFDLVHSQMMCSGIHVNRWTQYLRDIFRVVRGGGWCQMVEVYFNVQSDNGSLTPGRSVCIS